MSKRLLSILLAILILIGFSPAGIESMKAKAVNPGSISDYSEPYKNSIFYKALKNVELTGNQREDIVNIAKSQIGYQEGLSYDDLDGELNNGKTSPKKLSYLDGDKYSDYDGFLDACEYNYWRWNGSSGERFISSLKNPKPSSARYDVSNYDRAWCATFVAWCARQAGIPISVLNNSTFASPLSGSMNIPYVMKGSYTPVSGDIIYFGTSSVWKHVGIVESVDGNKLTYIDGNGDDNVSRHAIGINDAEIKAFGIPNYNGTSPLAAITWNNVYVTDITETTAVVKADVTANTGLLQRIGLEMCKDGYGYESVASWSVGSILNYCYVSCDGTEAPPLTKNTKYNYRFYVIKKDGTYEYSPESSFMTLGENENVISWDNIYVSDLKETSAEIKADVTAIPSAINEIGLQMGKENEPLKTVAHWPVKSILNYCYVKCDGTEAPKLEPGTRYYYCFYIIKTDGTYIYSSISTFATPCSHVFDSGYVTLSATCKETGTKTYTCTKCGDIKTEIIPITAHSFGEWTVTKQPTASAEGIKTHTCSTCGYKETQSVPKLNVDMTEKYVKMNYKRSVEISEILTYDGYEAVSSNPSVVRINGSKMEAVGKGSADVTISQNGVAIGIIHVDVKYTFFQVLIKIFLFGWIWY